MSASKNESSLQREKKEVKKIPFFVGWSKRKKWMIGFVLFIALICIVSWYLLQTVYAPYKVLFYDEDGKLDYKSFQTLSEFRKYITDHPVKAKENRGDPISVFYLYKDGKGPRFVSDPNDGYYNFNNNDVSSVETHKLGNYTIVFERKSGYGAAIAIPNTGDIYNIYDIPLRFGQTWDDHVYSTRVLSSGDVLE